MIILIGFIGMLLGQLFIGSILSFLFTKDEPEKATENAYSWVGRIIGALAAMIIYMVNSK